MHTLIAPTAAPTLEVIRGIRDDQLTALTPCTEFDVRGLLDHLRYWAPSLAGAGRKEIVEPGTSDDLEKALADLVEAWSAPAAWEGVTRLGEPMDLPASMIGGMVLGEVVVHGWDLAKATGQPVSWPDDVLQFLVSDVAGVAEQGRRMGLFGPEVAVPAEARAIDRIVGLTGRDPAWSAA